MRRAPLLFLVAATAVCWTAFADVGVFTGTGQNVRQVTTQAIHLSAIDVTICPGRGRQLFDGGVAGLDRVDYYCRFELTNPTDRAADVTVGFPLDSQFARLPAEPAATTAPVATTTPVVDVDPSADWVADYGFIARDPTTTYHVKFHGHPPTEAEPYSALFTWPMKFGPHDSRSLMVVYHIPASITLATTSRGEPGSGTPDPPRPWMGRLCNCMLERIGYTTATGSSWAGPVDHARFTVSTEEFEKYLDHRGGDETDRDSMPADQRKRLESVFPVAHNWWFREVTPTGAKKVEWGLSWSEANYKPSDPIMIGYYVTCYPRLAGEVGAWTDSILADDTPSERPADLVRLRQVLVARFGEVPADPAVKKWVEDQVWYHPDPKFAAGSLPEVDRAVIVAFDQSARRQTAAAK